MLTIQETACLLREMDDVLILTHVRPDGDTVGCATALCLALRQLGKTAYCLPNPEITPLNHRYIAACESPADFVPDKVVTVDIATPDLFPDNVAPYANRVDLAIDHHPSFEHFGKANYVRPEAAACGEILYDILAVLGCLNRETALPLYVAISTDTGCFVYTNTTAYTHQVAAALMQCGIDVRSVNKRHFRTKSRKRLALEATMLDTMTFHDEGRVVVLAIPLSLMARMEASEGDAEDLSALGGQIEGTDCAVTMRERKPDQWKISVRTGDRINATKACALLGGGGHAAAAGCMIDGDFETAKAKILDAVAQVAGN